MKYYVAGPMSHIPQFNFPAFFKARDELTAMGYSVLLPCDMDDTAAVEAAMASVDGKPGSSLLTWSQCLGKDVELIADHVKCIIFLPGWKNSRGARLEAFVGTLCGHKFMEYDFTGPPQDVSTDYVMRSLFNP